MQRFGIWEGEIPWNLWRSLSIGALVGDAIPHPGQDNGQDPILCDHEVLQWLCSRERYQQLTSLNQWDGFFSIRWSDFFLHFWYF